MLEMHSDTGAAAQVERGRENRRQQPPRILRVCRQHRPELFRQRAGHQRLCLARFSAIARTRGSRPRARAASRQSLGFRCVAPQASPSGSSLRRRRRAMNGPARLVSSWAGLTFQKRWRRRRAPAPSRPAWRWPPGGLDVPRASASSFQRGCRTFACHSSTLARAAEREHRRLLVGEILRLEAAQGARGRSWREAGPRGDRPGETRGPAAPVAMPPAPSSRSGRDPRSAASSPTLPPACRTGLS